MLVTEIFSMFSFSWHFFFTHFHDVFLNAFFFLQHKLQGCHGNSFQLKEDYFGSMKFIKLFNNFGFLGNRKIFEFFTHHYGTKSLEMQPSHVKKQLNLKMCRLIKSPFSSWGKENEPAYLTGNWSVSSSAHLIPAPKKCVVSVCFPINHVCLQQQVFNKDVCREGGGTNHDVSSKNEEEPVSEASSQWNVFLLW